ncbi:hypothetical protein SBDP1_550026 [Syntrophobacter sp. SbD1]|nr:hypothetical protein SBDP1_550026 [Syntrophobacter sp. SbD1]
MIKDYGFVVCQQKRKNSDEKKKYGYPQSEYGRLSLFEMIADHPPVCVGDFAFHP